MEDLSKRLAAAVRNLAEISTAGKVFNNLSSSEVALLSYINNNLSDVESKTVKFQMKTIAEGLGISRSALSQAVNRLEAKQILRRIGSTDGKRATYLRFTESGYKLFCDELIEYNGKIKYIINEIGENECNRFIETAEKISRIISDNR